MAGVLFKYYLMIPGILYFTLVYFKTRLMKQYLILLVSCMVLNVLTCYSQDFEVPNYVLKEKEDYTKYEKDMIAAEKWLVNTPIKEQTFKRREVSAFVIEWVDGSPTVNCELFSFLVDLEKKNNGMLAVYMAATARYVLENNYSKELRPKHLFALKELMLFYNNNKAMKKDKKMDKLISADEKNELDAWMEENMKMEK